jgi:hypothetical protein
MFFKVCSTSVHVTGDSHDPESFAEKNKKWDRCYDFKNIFAGKNGLFDSKQS